MDKPRAEVCLRLKLILTSANNTRNTSPSTLQSWRMQEAAGDESLASCNMHLAKS